MWLEAIASTLSDDPSACMEQLANAGIYGLADLVAPGLTIGSRAEIDRTMLWSEFLADRPIFGAPGEFGIPPELPGKLDRDSMWRIVYRSWGRKDPSGARVKATHLSGQPPIVNRTTHIPDPTV